MSLGCRVAPKVPVVHHSGGQALSLDPNRSYILFVICSGLSVSLFELNKKKTPPGHISAANSSDRLVLEPFKI